MLAPMKIIKIFMITSKKKEIVGLQEATVVLLEVEVEVL